jgi:hypothetical protein
MTDTNIVQFPSHRQPDIEEERPTITFGSYDAVGHRFLFETDYGVSIVERDHAVKLALKILSVAALFGGISANQRDDLNGISQAADFWR